MPLLGRALSLPGIRSLLAEYMKKKVNGAMKFVERFEQAVIAEARHHRVDGVVCGHIHYANMREIDGLLYCNTGDWVGSATTLVEDADGGLELLHWVDHGTRGVARLPAAA